MLLRRADDAGLAPADVDRLPSPSRLLRKWLVAMLALDLAWEIAQLPLYRLPASTMRFYAAYSVAHCTVGDVLIAAALYLLAWLLLRAPRWPLDAPVAGVSTVLGAGVAYAAYSEWRNVYVLGSWAYSNAMPTLLGIGAAPLAQWIVIPPIALWLVRRRARADAR